MKSHLGWHNKDQPVQAGDSSESASQHRPRLRMELIAIPHEHNTGLQTHMSSKQNSRSFQELKEAQDWQDT